MKHLTVLALVLLAACGGGGGGESSPQQSAAPPAPGDVKIACARVHNNDGMAHPCVAVTPGSQVWLGAVDRDRMMFLEFRVENTTSGAVSVPIEIVTTLATDQCAGSQFPRTGPMAAETITVAPGQFTPAIAVIYCPGAELNRQQQFQPTITVNGVRTFIDGVFDVTQ